MPSPKKAPAPKPGPVDPAETHNKRILAERQRDHQRSIRNNTLWINEHRKPENASEFLADEFDKKTFGHPRFVLNQTWNGHIFSWQQIGCQWRIVTDAPALVARQFLAACTG